MKSAWSRILPLLRVVLAAGLIVSTLVAPAVAPKVALAQAAGTFNSPVVVGRDGATLYATPGGAQAATFPVGTTLSPVGRSADSKWIQVRTDNGSTGWVQAAAVIGYGLDRLPVTDQTGAGQAQAGQGSTTSASNPVTPTVAATAVAPVAATATPVAATATPVAATATPVPPTATPTAVPPTATPAPTVAPTVASTVAPTVAPTVAATAAQPAAQPAASGSSVLPAPRQQTAVVIGSNVGVYDMPGGKQVGTLPMAERVTAALRNRAGDWLFVTSSAGVSGWVPTSSLIVFGVEGLPVLEPSGAGATAGSTAATAPVTGTAAAGSTSPATETLAAGTATTVTAGAGAAMTETQVASIPMTVPVGAGAGVTATVTISDARLNIRSGPDSSYRIIGKAGPGEELMATGRTQDSAWVQVVRSDLGKPGWVTAQYVQLADLAALPVVEGAETATGAGAAAPTATESAAGGAMPAATPTAAPKATASAATETPAASGNSGSNSGGNGGGLPTPTPQVDSAKAEQALAAVGTVSIGQPSAKISAKPVPGLSGKIVFQDGNNNIYVYNLETGDVRWLVNGYEPAVSPDGTQVAYVVGGGPDNGIWAVNMDGSNARKVHGGGELMNSPKWSPDGQYIVFSRNFSNWKCFDTPYFGCVSLFELETKFPGIPKPIRAQIIYKFLLKNVDRITLPNWGLTRVKPDGTEFRDINALDSAQAPDWNEAGIVYQAKPGIEITYDTPDGRTRSVFHDAWDWDPDWQPNGGRIVYQSKEGSHWEIWAINPDGTGLVALTHPETTLVDQLPSNVAPAFSPDGQHIVYLSSRRGDEDNGPWRLWVMNADGGNKRPLPINVPIDYNFSGAQVASWTK